MADINHPAVTGLGLPSVAVPVVRGLTSGIATLGRAAMQAVGIGAAITAVDTLAGDGDQGVVSFNLDLSRDDTRISNVSEMTTQELANSLRIEQRPDTSVMAPEDATSFLERDADGTAVLNELLFRLALSDAESDTITNVIERKVEMSEPDGNAFASRVPDPLLEAFVDDSVSTPVNEGELTPENRARLPNRTLDGRRVSREYGEYQYCRSSGQLASALNFLYLWDQGELQDVGESLHEEGGAGDFGSSDFLGDVISYGQFVDMVCLRRFIALRRNLLRKVRAANVRCILALTNPPTDPELLARRILAGVNHTQTVQEIIRTFNRNVGVSTNQEACSPTGGATRAIEDRRQAMEEFGSGGQGQT